MKQIVPAKLTRPNTQTALPRERLFQLIERSRDKKVIWISGPAGSGKTTLAASYIQTAAAACLWYQLDEGDSDISTFFYYMGLAARMISPRNRTHLPLLTPEYLLGIPVFAKRFFEKLCEKLNGKRDTRSSEYRSPVIVFDNYQDVPENSQFHGVINSGFSSIPRGVNVIVLSRGEPPPAYVRLRAAGEMSIVGWEDIRLTADESDSIARLRAGKDLEIQTLSLLRKASEGWVAGLVLLIESLRIEDHGFQLPGGLPREEIFGYFATEVFDRSSQDSRDFLLETSFLPKMSVRMAEELTGNLKASRILNDLNRKNYFTSRYASNGQVFQYHPLFREFLLNKAKETIAPERLTEIRSRAAQVLEKDGHLEDAVSLFLEVEEWPEAIRLILTNAPALISQGRSQTLAGWIESFPESVTEHEPWLLYWMGVCRFPTSPETARDCFAKALARFRGRRDAAGSFLAMSGMLDSVSLRLDTFFELDRLIPLADEILEEYQHQFPSPQIESGMAASMIYALMLRQPDNPAFEYWESRCFALAGSIAEKDTVLHMLLALAFYRIYSGELEKVPLIIDSFGKLVEASHYAPLSVILQRAMQAFYGWLSGGFGEGRWAAEDAIALADSTGVHVYDVVLHAHCAACLLSIGEFAKAEESLENMRFRLRIIPSAWGEYAYHLFVAWSSLIQRDFARASLHADLALKFNRATGAPFVMPYAHLIDAMVMHELQNDKEASVHISEVWRICSTVHVYQAEFMTLLLEAQIAFDNGSEDAGRELLHRAMALGKEHGYFNGPFWVNSTMARLCVKALEAGIETDYVQGLIRRRNLMPDVPVLHLENWPWPLRIYTLGQFEILRDSEALRFTGKVQQKPLLLLKALIAFGGRAVKEEQLCDALWPDAEGDLAHLSLETTLHRLRKLIGKDRVIQFKEGKLTLDIQSCWVDAFALRKVLDRAEDLWTSGQSQADSRPLQDNAAQAIHLTQSAIALYKGHFFEGEPEQPWMVSPRERMRTKYLRGIETLAGYWEDTGELEMAIKCCEKALEVDDLAEELYRHLIICYQKLGLRAKAFEVYTRYRSVLEAGLGLKPSSLIESLVKNYHSM
jgi:DNA-binding SARP family transcriptional activator